MTKKENGKQEIVKIDEQTQNDLCEINRLMLELNSKVQIIIRTYIAALGKKGDYFLSSDLATLVKQEASVQNETNP